MKWSILTQDWATFTFSTSRGTMEFWRSVMFKNKYKNSYEWYIILKMYNKYVL